MSDDLRGPLADIQANLERLGRRVTLGALRAGLDAQRTRSRLQEVGLRSPAAVERLYAWRDGTEMKGAASLDDLHFFPGFYLLSLDDAIANYRAFVTDARWSPGWLPIFANGGGDFYVTDLAGDMPAGIRHFRIEESEHPVEFMSLPDMLKTLAAAYERGVFFVDANGYLEMDDAAFAEVAANLNPGVRWWTD